MPQTNSAILNFIGGEWRRSSSADMQDVVNPATAKMEASTAS
jgi:acyl-CoA reductase-like NAD-dependent aldehyde dehydrogenase